MHRWIRRYDLATTAVDVLIAVVVYSVLVRGEAARAAPVAAHLGHPLTLLGIATALVFLLLIRLRYATSSRRWLRFAPEVWALAQVTLLGSAFVLLSALLIVPSGAVAGSLLPFPALVFLLLLSAHALTRYALGRVRLAGRNLRYVVLVGDGRTEAEYVRRLTESPQTGLRLTTRVLAADGVAPWQSDLLDALHGGPVDAVVVALPITNPALAEAVSMAEREGKEVRVLLDGFGARLSRGSASDFLGLPMLGFTPTGVAASTALARAAKRTLDLVGAALVLVVLSPFALLAALVIKLDDPSAPVLYRQARVGRNGREFVLYKLRTMRPDADALVPLLRAANEMDGPVFKIRNDPRVTRPGRILRRLSLDEYPQLWNVLLGEMSLVGPRPPLPAEVERYARHDYRRRLAVRPGLTGPWQVSGRNEVPFERWMELDLDYVDHWTLGRDIAILAQTVGAVVSGRGAS